MDKGNLLRYLDYISKLCSKELKQGIKRTDSLVEKELQVLKNRKEIIGLSPKITAKINSLEIDRTLSLEDETRYFFGLLSRLRPFREDEKQKRGLEDLRAKIDHLIIEVKMHG